MTKKLADSRPSSDPWDSPPKVWVAPGPSVRRFLKYGSIAGRSKHPRYREWIEVDKIEYTSGYFKSDIVPGPESVFGPLTSGALFFVVSDSWAGGDLAHEFYHGTAVQAVVATVSAAGVEIRRSIHHGCRVRNFKLARPSVYQGYIDFVRTEVSLISSAAALLAVPAQLADWARGFATSSQRPPKGR